jgi:ligand-binding sensor domain-containing protein
MRLAVAGLVTLASVSASTATAVAAPAGRVAAVETDVGEARACLPLAGGGALIGTGGGLVRVDAGGAVQGTWTAASGLPGTRIEAIVELGDQVWIGTDAGAARVTIDAGAGLTIGKTVASRPVRALARLGATTYVATWDGGVRVLAAGKPLAFTDAKPGKLTGAKAAAAKAAAAARSRASSLAVVDGALYAGTAAGLYRLDGSSLAPIAVDGLPAGTPITALAADGETLWIATPEGLFARAADGGTRALGGGDLRALAIVDGAVVAAGIADGLVRVDRGRLVALAGAPRGLAVAQTVAARADGAMCAGGLTGAWLRAGGAADWTAVEDRAAAGPPSNDISALAVDGDRLWVGTFDHGVAVRGADGSWRAIDHAEIDGRVNAIVVEPRAGKPSRIWIATANGLSTIDGDATTKLVRRDGLPGRGVLALALLRDGRMLAGTSYGAVIIGDGRPTRLDPKGTRTDGGGDGAVWSVVEDADGLLWLGTTTGLYRGRPGDAEWQRFSFAGGALRDDWITALVARGRSIYAGTYNAGITRFDLPTDDAPVQATQLGDGWINPGGLAFDGDRLLASTMDGLFLGTGDTTAWTRLAGLPGKDVTAAIRLGASLFVSTRRGLAEVR